MSLVHCCLPVSCPDRAIQHFLWSITRLVRGNHWASGARQTHTVTLPFSRTCWKASFNLDHERWRTWHLISVFHCTLSLYIHKSPQRVQLRVWWTVERNVLIYVTLHVRQRICSGAGAKGKGPPKNLIFYTHTFLKTEFSSFQFFSPSSFFSSAISQTSHTHLSWCCCHLELLHSSSPDCPPL